MAFDNTHGACLNRQKQLPREKIFSFMEVREVGRRKKPFLLTAELFISRNLFVTDEHKFWSCRTSIFMNASLIQHSFSSLLSRLRHSMRSQSCKLKIPSSSSWQWIATQRLYCRKQWSRLCSRHYAHQKPGLVFAHISSLGQTIFRNEGWEWEGSKKCAS